MNSEYYEVGNDAGPSYSFTGKLLGHATTERENSYRWTEIDIYKTDGGNYIVSRLGKSLIYHTGDSECTNMGIPIKGGRIREDAEPCERCDPAVPEDDDFDPEATFLAEKTMSSSEVVADPRRVADALSTWDKYKKMRRLSSVASEALHKAAAADPDLLNNILTTVHVP